MSKQYRQDIAMRTDKMRVSSVQLDMKFCDIDYNYDHAKALLKTAAENEKADVLVLPETWTTGFYPKQSLHSYCDKNGERIKSELSALAKELDVNLVAGSTPTLKDGKAYNTAYVFSRTGECIAEYDKTHLFTPMNEDGYFEFGDHVSTFFLDGKKCGIIICYDVRFPELSRTLALEKIEMLFVVSQWPDKRIPHLEALTRARAIENQMFVVCCNSCGKAGDTVYGGASQTVDPLGNILCKAGDTEEIITADCDFSQIKEIRESINVFNDRKTKLYNI